jgi:hypothetical protein
MAKEDKKNQFIAIRSMYLSDSVKRMKDIEKLYPTLMARSLGMNHSRYIQKLYNPEEFTIRQIYAFASLIGLDVQIVLDVIIKQIKAQKGKNI